MQLLVDIVSPSEEVYSGSATAVIAASETGELCVMPRHAPLLTRIKAGPVRVLRDQGDEETFFVVSGILEAQSFHVTVLADTVERAADIDAAEAEKAKIQAENAIVCAKDRIDLARAQAEMAEAAARLKSIRKSRDGRQK